MPAVKLFISYTHDSPEHQDRARALADRLRADGIDARIDQYVPAPPEGWPFWMDEQIRTADFVLLVCTETYLQRVERRAEPGKGRGVLWEAHLIYNSLYPDDADVQKFIPVLYNDCQPSWIPLRLRGLTHYRVDAVDGYEDLYRHLTNQPRYQVPVLGEPKSLPTIAPQSYPASPGAKLPPKPTTLDQRHRQQMIKQVRLDWIQGVLDQSLYKVARLELGLTDRSDFVEQPLNAVVQIPDRAPQVVSPGTPISRIFDEQAGALLILGAPGTGKTTLLLELARDLLDRADHDETQPIAVVFNLSSWGARRQPLNEWIIAELNERSYVPKRVARQWIEGEQILPLLDGLDEVAAPHRDACVDAINQFRREHGLLHIAVCSRIADYEALGTKLRLRSAVEVQPLTRPQVEDYLERVGEPLRGLGAVLQDDPAFWELLETPLMLWVGMLAYRNEPRVSVHEESLERRRHTLFARFVEAMFRSRGGRLRYSVEQTTRWLSYLARTLAAKEQAVFYLENLDFDWMPTSMYRWIARGGVVLVSSLLFWLGGGARFRLNTGLNPLSGALIFGLTTSLLKVRPVERPRFRIGQWSRIPVLLIDGLRSGLLSVELTFALIFGLSFGLTAGLSFGLDAGLSFGLDAGLNVGLSAVLLKLFTSEAVAETRSQLNQGTRQSVENAVLFGLLFGLLKGLSVLGRTGWLTSWVSFGLVFGLRSDVLDIVLRIVRFYGTFFGLLSGGLFALKNFVLRLALWLSRSAPLRYVVFLNEAKDLLFLRQVGGGYIFTHRLLRDYFASLPSHAGKEIP